MGGQIDQLSSDIGTLQEQYNDLLSGHHAMKVRLEIKENELSTAEEKASVTQENASKLESELAKRNTRAVSRENSRDKVGTFAATVFIPKKDGVIRKASKSPPAVKSAKQPSNSKPDKPSLQKKSLLVSDALSDPRKSKKKGQQPIKPLSTKKRNFIKQNLNNKYTISTEEKLRQRKYRMKDRENFKGMKQFFRVKK